MTGEEPMITLDSEVLCDHGRPTAFDDPAVRKVASQYGDPDELLREDWIPQIPGITSAGSYEEYARNPGKWIYT